jgi:hypothetical protein
VCNAIGQRPTNFDAFHRAGQRHSIGGISQRIVRRSLMCLAPVDQLVEIALRLRRPGDVRPLNIQKRLGDLPAISFCANQIRGWDAYTVEELLGESGIPGHRPNRAAGHPGGLQIDKEEGNPSLPLLPHR